MDESKKNTRVSPWLKWPLIIVLCLLVLVGVLRLALMTGPVHGWVKSTIVDTAKNQLNPALSIGSLSGDLWGKITLTDVRLTQDTTVALADTIHVEYDVLSYFGDAFQINELRVVNPFLKVEQQDNTYNVQQWVKPAPQDTAASQPFAFTVNNLSITGGRVDASLPQILPDSSILITNMNLAASAGYFGDEYRARMTNFSFDITNTRLDAPVSFDAAAHANQSSISLEKLAIATGHSMLNASGRASIADSTAYFEARANPIGWRDLAAYADSLPMQKDINLELALSGSINDFEVSLEANADGIENLLLCGSFQGDSVLALSSLGASADRLNLESFMGDTSMPQLQNLSMQLNGRVPLENYQQGRLDGTISAENLHQSGYQLDALQATLVLNAGYAKIRIEPVSNGQRLVINANLSRIWGEQPSVYLAFSGDDINPANWLPEQSLSGSLKFNGNVSGTGWFPEQNAWKYELNIDDSQLMDQQLDEATFSGQFSTQMLTTQSQVTIADSRFELQAEVRGLQSIPEFTYSLGAEHVNLADFSGFEEYPSDITAMVTGEGQGTSLENLRMQTSVKADSSTLNGERVTQLVLDVRLADSLVTFEQGKLSSTIADAAFNGQLHLRDFYSAENNLDLDIQVKDISSFASVAEAEILQATGRIEGRLRPVGQDSLVFDGSIDMKDINYDSQFIADGITGAVNVSLAEEPAYNVDLSINEPILSSLNLQNISLKTQGQLVQSTPEGSFEIALEKAGEGSIFSAGRYRISGDTSSVTLNEFDLTSTLRTLSLQQPFHARYSGGAIQTDTLRIQSKDESAFMELAVPFADSLQQRVYFKADNLNLAVIQDAVFDDAYFEGTVFGEVQLNRTDSTLQTTSDVVMSGLVYQQTELDTLRLQANIQDERLQGMMELYQNGDLIVEGSADIPFTTKDPSTLPASFFKLPVSGNLQLHAVELNRFNTLLEQFGYEDTQGTLQFDGTLDGEVGQPQLHATLSLTEAELSGVPIDSMITSLDYSHENSSLDLNTSVTSLKQEALRADAQIPLNIDMRTLEVSFPGPKDSVSIDVVADDFNLRALNEFFNPQIARNLQGRLNGNVQISGPRNNLQTDGQLTLQNGAIRVVRAGIRLDGIRSTLLFEPGRIVVDNLRMNSGNGRLTAQGHLEMDQLVPGDLNITVNAKNFRAANTDQFNALINLGLKVTDSITSPDVSGNLEMISGFAELDNFGEKSVEQVQLDTTLAPETQTSLYDSLSLNMDIEFDRRFFVRNERYLEMEIELEGELDILKNAGQDLQLFGTLNTVQGYARPLGKQFELEEGTLAFSGPPDNPQINIRTLYEPPQTDQEVQIWYVIEGTVEDPQFKYESKPPMDLAGIISYTLFGQPFYKLNPAEQSVASSSSNNAAADFAMEVLLDRLESIATRRLGIDVVRIEQTRIGGESGTSITTGWYVNPKVFFAIQNVITGSTPTTGFYLEYYLRENLKLILSQGNENRQGVDLQWEHDY